MAAIGRPTVASAVEAIGAGIVDVSECQKRQTFVRHQLRFTLPIRSISFQTMELTTLSDSANGLLGATLTAGLAF